MRQVWQNLHWKKSFPVGFWHQEGMVIVERSAQIPLAPIKGLYVDREKNYKTTVITFLRPEESAT